MDWFGNLMIWCFDFVGKRPIVFIALMIAFIVLVAYGGWHLKRWVNWELAYGDDVKFAVCEMIKTEALKDPSMCEK